MPKVTFQAIHRAANTVPLFFFGSGALQNVRKHAFFFKGTLKTKIIFLLIQYHNTENTTLTVRWRSVSNKTYEKNVLVATPPSNSLNKGCDIIDFGGIYLVLRSPWSVKMRYTVLCRGQRHSVLILKKFYLPELPKQSVMPRMDISAWSLITKLWPWLSAVIMNI